MYAEAEAATIDMTERLGVVTREFHVRIVNFSPSGCLIETNARIDVGTVGSLAIVIDGVERVDPIRVVRCQAIAGAGSVYHIGAQFLWTAPPDSRTLRGAVIARNGADGSARTPPT
jgi:hypothetical protein